MELRVCLLILMYHCIFNLMNYARHCTDFYQDALGSPAYVFWTASSTSLHSSMELMRPLQLPKAKYVEHQSILGAKYVSTNT